MCGLSGVMSSSIAWGEEALFKDLLNVSSLRGQEGSGVIVAQAHARDPVIRSLRTKQISGTLAYSDELAGLLKPRVNAIIGHARWPTKGGVDIKSVHPHRFEHIIGVHNGTLTQVAGEAVKDRSDSAMLFESFAKIGVQETMKNTEGAYALVWVDERDRTINFLRNGQRTLFFKNIGWNENVQTVFWASEMEMLDFVFKRGHKGSNVWNTYLPVDRWYKYPLEVKHIIRPIEVVDCKPEAKPYVPFTQGSYRHGGGGATTRHNPRDWDDADDLPWQRFDNGDDIRDRKVTTLRYSPLLNRMVPDDYDDVAELNRRRLPSPVNVEEKLQELIDKPPVAASTDTKQTTLSKQAQKRLVKGMKKQEAAASRRLKHFRGTAAKEVIPDISEIEDTSITPSLNDEVKDLFPERPIRRFLACVGRGCAWCGTIAEIADDVYPTSTDLGNKDFICQDCSTNDDIKPYIEGVQSAIACTR